MSLKQVWRLLKQAFQEWNQDKASQLAAALAYYTLFSLAPLLILAIAIASLFFDNGAVREQLMGQVESLMGGASADFVRTVLDNANRPGENSGWVASAISVVLLLVGATGVLSQLQLSLNTIWNLEARPGIGLIDQVRKRLLSLGMVIVIGFLLLVSLIASSMISGFSGYLSMLMPGLDALVQFLNFVLAFGLSTLLFAVMFKYLPDAIIAWRDVWFGAAATAILFSIGKYLIGLYLGNSSFGSSYGAAGSVIILLVWVFYSAQILFYGAELTQVYSCRFGSQIKPNKYAVQRDPSPEQS
ncbi:MULTISPECIES: YihY/virulence factor BrkB family protein [Cyanophyceae]|uniref:YihY/virulence factor BrkB family protein n=1 Tax=Cyanophyceae TaxID=3028117 RepID=UPI0016868B5B|nr:MULTISPECIES: YihY/virulence factor BrkB family protein [Cyanophyceae]MBD1915057.1 YihY/virulence factor BrkB family protein [Phormidium sp. FACHB-77]MBD2030803.1 YihY/virulence factor BrkB family protein [Phormidium sp. FACHB-322]MBD2053157.1 YihY/virulence factor BrkB family protein [Leptolyngbya sp. FACHB-60]